MCEHEGREHRTSPCWQCRAEAASLPAMPLLWQPDGDQA